MPGEICEILGNLSDKQIDPSTPNLSLTQELKYILQGWRLVAQKP